MTVMAPERAAARLLYQARVDRTCLANVVEAVRPADNQSALAVQDHVSELLAERGDFVRGWKCATPSGIRIIAAPIYDSGVYLQPAADAVVQIPVHGRLLRARVEPELAIELARDLPPRSTRYSDVEIDAAIAGVRIALEIIGARYIDPDQVTFPELLADGLLNSGLVLGRELLQDLHSIPARLDIRVATEDAAEVDHAGTHPEGSLLRPLYWLVNFLSERGVGLRAGQVVITGSYAGVLSIPTAQAVSVRFGSLGSLVVRFGFV